MMMIVMMMTTQPITVGYQKIGWLFPNPPSAAYVGETIVLYVAVDVI